MSVFAVAAGKGAPGVTTTALALAAVWPRQSLLAECDPAGGDVVFAFRREDGAALAADRGVMSLATAVRLPAAQVDVMAHAQVIDGGLPVLVGVSSLAQANALAWSWRTIAEVFATAAVDVFADCGRLDGAAPVDELLAGTDRLLLVCRATAAGVAHTRSALELARARHPQLGVSLVVIGGAGADTEVAAALRGLGELDVLGPLAVDPDGAAGLLGRWTRRLDRSPLVVSARQVARAVEARRSTATHAQQLDAPALSMPGVS